MTRVSSRWLLIFDSEGISEYWLKTLHGRAEVVTISYYSSALRSTLESAISEGKSAKTLAYEVNMKIWICVC